MSEYEHLLKINGLLKQARREAEKLECYCDEFGFDCMREKLDRKLVFLIQDTEEYKEWERSVGV